MKCKKLGCNNETTHENAVYCPECATEFDEWLAEADEKMLSYDTIDLCWNRGVSRGQRQRHVVMLINAISQINLPADQKRNRNRFIGASQRDWGLLGEGKGSKE